MIFIATINEWLSKYDFYGTYNWKNNLNWLQVICEKYNIKKYVQIILLRDVRAKKSEKQTVGNAEFRQKRNGNMQQQVEHNSVSTLFYYVDPSSEHW